MILGVPNIKQNQISEQVCSQKQSGRGDMHQNYASSLLGEVQCDVMFFLFLNTTSAVPVVSFYLFHNLLNNYCHSKLHVSLITALPLCVYFFTVYLLG